MQKICSRTFTAIQREDFGCFTIRPYSRSVPGASGPAPLERRDSRSPTARPWDRGEYGKLGARSVDRSRQVLISRCPLNTTVAEVAQCFPTADFVSLTEDDGFFFGFATVTFPTADKARTAASRVDVFVGGNRVRLIWRGLKSMPRDVHHAEVDLRRLYIHGCPASATEADVLREFPGAEAATFVLRQPSLFYGTAVVYCRSAADAQQAAGRDVTILGNRVRLTLGATKDPAEWRAWDQEARKRCLYIRHCPTANVGPRELEVEIRRSYPAAECIVLMKNRGQLTGMAFVRFATILEAHDALRSKLWLLGCPVKTELARPPKDIR